MLLNQESVDSGLQLYWCPRRTSGLAPPIAPLLPVVYFFYLIGTTSPSPSGRHHRPPYMRLIPVHQGEPVHWGSPGKLWPQIISSSVLIDAILQNEDTAAAEANHVPPPSGWRDEDVRNGDASGDEKKSFTEEQRQGVLRWLIPVSCDVSCDVATGASHTHTQSGPVWRH